MLQLRHIRLRRGVHECATRGFDLTESLSDGARSDRHRRPYLGRHDAHGSRAVGAEEERRGCGKQRRDEGGSRNFEAHVGLNFTPDSDEIACSRVTL